MSPFDASLLAAAGLRDRRFLATLIRLHRSRATEEDTVRCPPRLPGEPLARWICRCRAPNASLADLERAAAALERDARRDLARAAAAGLVPLPLDAAGFPDRLAAIADPPALLWVRGQMASLAGPAIAVVGSRAATGTGLAMARRLAADLAAAGRVVVSGLARGVDAAAHNAALEAGGLTVAVLGSGADRIYPSEHAALADRIAAAGAVVSDFPPGTPPRAFHFPLRNRLVSGLAAGVVVVEAPEKSGALITAGLALDQGREVFVVPGAVLGGRNRGGHLLLRDGAKLVESADDILRELDGSPGPGTPRAEAPGSLGTLAPDEVFTVDELAARLDEPPGRVLARLLQLELDGVIQRIGSGRFVRSSNRVLT